MLPRQQGAGVTLADLQGGVPPMNSPLDVWQQNTMRPGGRTIPRDFDQMVVPPYTQPPDQNTFDPNDLLRLYFESQRSERT